MNVQFNKQILQSTVTGLKRYKELLQSQGFSKTQIRSKMFMNIFQVNHQESQVGQASDRDLLFFSLKKSMSKFKSINQALIQFLLNLQLQITMLGADNEVGDKNESINQDNFLRQNKQSNQQASISQQKQLKLRKQKKRGKKQKQKKVIKQIQKQAQVDLFEEKHKLQENLQQIQLLKQILHKKILLQYFKTQALENHAMLLLAI